MGYNEKVSKLDNPLKMGDKKRKYNKTNMTVAKKRKTEDSPQEIIDITEEDMEEKRNEKLVEKKRIFSCCCCDKTFDTEDYLKSHVAGQHTYTFNLFNQSSIQEEITWDVEIYFQSLYEEYMGDCEEHVFAGDIGDILEDDVVPEEYVKACNECVDDFYWTTGDPATENGYWARLKFRHECFFIQHNTRVVGGKIIDNVPKCLADEKASSECKTCNPTISSDVPKNTTVQWKPPMEKKDNIAPIICLECNVM